MVYGTMIVSFKDTTTQTFAETGKTKQGWQSAASVAMRKIDALRAATKLDDLRVPPGNKLEALVGDRAGQHSIRINDQWRLCFRWTAHGAEDVEITDYH
jgi:toxin HigB-1